MKKFLQAITDRISTKKGMWMTLASWLVITMLLAMFSPSAKDYEVTSIESLPENAKSMIAQNKIKEYFQDQDGISGILVFQTNEGELEYEELADIVEVIIQANVEGLDQVVPVSSIPRQAAMGFFSEDETTAVIPLTFHPSLENKEIKSSKDEIISLVEQHSNLEVYMTGPAGIATDTLDLFSRADLVLLFSTIGLILVLLIIIYRSPLLALIPLLAAAFVYEAVMQILGIMGSSGLLMTNQTLSIMSVLLFAAVIDYSLFVFSRFREELKVYDEKYEAMRQAMRGTGLPVFFSGGTVLAAMLVLFFAITGDYNNFAPTFATNMAVIMIASITLVPALFLLFGRKSFWPKIPQVGDEKVKSNTVWKKIGRLVAKKPVLSVVLVGLFMVISASHLFNLKYDYNLLNSFPEDMPSRYGYHVLEEKFDKGDLAPTTVLLESNESVTEAQQESLKESLENQPLVSNVRMSGTEENGQVIQYSLTFSESPYSIEAIDAMEEIINNEELLLSNNNLEGSLYFAGETARQVDDRSNNDRDLIVIVLLETILIFLLLMVMTKSFKMPIYMMGTILVSFFAALGLGMFLTELFFGIETISNRVPLYAFIFLVALGIDYNIMLVSRFQEERQKHPVKKAVELAVANTGGVISSAGIILAATFAVLMTQPIQLLFVFGFIVAVGILIDTFLVRGVLMPGLIVLLEKDK